MIPEMQNCNLYLDIDGVLLRKHPQTLAENGRQFLETVVEHFDCYWLTTHCRGGENNAISYLTPYLEEQTLKLLHRIKPAWWETMKTDGIDLGKPFFWIDDQPFEAEKQVLRTQDFESRLIIVDLDRPNELMRIQKHILFGRCSLT